MTKIERSFHALAHLSEVRQLRESVEKLPEAVPSGFATMWGKWSGRLSMSEADIDELKMRSPAASLPISE
jgi:hypothetical protein